MHAPQLIYLALTFMAVGITAAKHGQPREPYSLGMTVFSAATSFGLLYWGGFFGGAA